MHSVFGYVKKKAARGRYLEHFEQVIAKGGASEDTLAGIVALASAGGDVEKASRVGVRLVEACPGEISLHQNAAVGCFLDGNYQAAKAIWTRSQDERARLVKERNLDRHNRRFLGPAWFIAIGHIAHLDTYLKHQILLGNGLRRLEPVIPGNVKVPNRYLLDLWKPYFNNDADEERLDFDLPLVSLLQDEFWSIRFGPRDTEMFSYAGARVQREWEARKLGPLLSIPEDDRDRGWNEMEKLGVPRNGWFVCLHVREPGFHKTWHNAYPGTRNADVLTYLLAAQRVIEQGGFVIRMGDPTMKKLPPMTGLIDYAHSEAKSEFMDIFLCAMCRFFIGTNSGLGLVPPVFGVPCAMTNWSPIGLPQWYPADRFIPKLIYSETEERVLTFNEMLSTPAGWSQFETFFARGGLRVIDNTPEELRDLVEEMIEEIEGTVRHSDGDISLIRRFERLMSDRGSYHGARIGLAFLRQHAKLFDRESEPRPIEGGSSGLPARIPEGAAEA